MALLKEIAVTSNYITTYYDSMNDANALIATQYEEITNIRK